LLKIGVDIDGVITNGDFTPWKNAFIEYFGLNNEENIEINGFNIDEISKKHNIKQEELLNFYSDKTEDIVPKLKVNKKAVKYINKLYEENEIYIITSRTKTQRTYYWLKDNRIPFDDLIHNHNKDYVCNSLNIDIHIDDSINQVNSIAENSCIPVLLFDRPYNKNCELNSKVERVKSFKQIYKKIKGVKFSGSEQRF